MELKNKGYKITVTYEVWARTEEEALSFVRDYDLQEEEITIEEIE